METIKEVTGKLVIEPRARTWCRFPYPGHKRGCPNFDHKAGCPPRVGLVGDVFDLGLQHWFAIVDFDLAAHMARMKAKHPDWSDRQAACCLYWQNGVRSRLEKLCRASVLLISTEALPKTMVWRPGCALPIYTDCPEAMGVNVFRTAETIGIRLERNPRTTVYKIALIGYSRSAEMDRAV